MIDDRSVRVLEQIDLGADYFILRLEWPDRASDIEAGQFVMIGLPDLNEMLIRRPFSVARIVTAGERQAIDILYKAIGRGTRAFSRLTPGASVSILGPLGRGFTIPPADSEGGEEPEVVMVAGGIGNAPFPLVLQQIGEERSRDAVLFFGGRSRADLTLLDWFREHCKVVTATEDGSEGAKGFVTGPLSEYLDESPDRQRVVLTCGPVPMMRAVAEICLERGVPCQLAMEETMACGFGVCLGCVVPKSEPESDFERYVRVCVEGPVFDAREIVV